jgi:hypothetical protein
VLLKSFEAQGEEIVIMGSSKDVLDPSKAIEVFTKPILGKRGLQDFQLGNAGEDCSPRSKL